MKIKNSLFVVFFLVNINLFSQQFYFRQFTPEDGLPSSIVYDFEQDSKGIMWMGTENGLCAFDGRQFRTYTMANGLPNNAVYRLAIDQMDRKWLTTLSKSPAYLKNEEVFIPDWADDFEVKNYIISCTSDSLVWFASAEEKEGSYYYNPIILNYPDGRVKRFSKTYANTNGKLIELNNRVIIPYNPFFLHYQKGELLHKEKRKFGTPIWHCKPYRNSILCIGRAFSFNDKLKHQILGLLEIDPYQASINKEWVPIRPYLQGENTRSMFVDRDENVWLGLRNGLLFIDPTENGGFTQKLFLEGISVNRVQEDHEGNIWVGTEGSGAFFLASTTIQSLFKQKELQGADIRALEIDEEGNIYLGYTNGFIEIYDSKFNLLLEKKISERRIVDFLTDPGGMYVATDTELILISKDKSIAWQKSNSGPLKSMVKTNDHLFLLSSQLLKLDNDTIQSIDFPPSLRIYTGTAINDSTLWLGTTEGLFEYAINQDTFSPLYPKVINSDVRGIKVNYNGDLWICTLGQGIFIVRNGQLWTQLTTATSSLPSDLCNDMILDERYAWVATNRGVTCIDHKSLEFANFNLVDGLSSSEVKYITKLDQNIIAATDKGLDIIPDNIQKYIDPPLFYVNQIQFGDSIYPIQERYHLPHFQNNLNITFTGISYKSLGDITYAYQLEGVDKDWIESKENFANWSSIASGDYCLRLKAKGKNGIWSKEKVIYIEIIPPWWRTWWFTILAIALTILLIGTIFQAVVQNIRRQNTLQKRLLELRLTALRAQMNPHFMFNALNSIQEFINTRDLRSANLYLSNFASLVRSILNNSSQEKVLLSEEINQLEKYISLENLRFDQEIQYSLKIDKHLKPQQVLIPTLLVQPFVENAILHGLFHKEGEKKLEVHFNKKNKEVIECIVKDNGIGRQQSNKINQQRRYYDGASKGVGVTRNRLDLLNRTSDKQISLEIVDHINPSGTSVKLSIPYTTEES